MERQGLRSRHSHDVEEGYFADDGDDSSNRSGYYPDAYSDTEGSSTNDKVSRKRIRSRRKGSCCPSIRAPLQSTMIRCRSKFFSPAITNATSPTATSSTNEKTKAYESSAVSYLGCPTQMNCLYNVCRLIMTRQNYSRIQPNEPISEPSPTSASASLLPERMERPLQHQQYHPQQQQQRQHLLSTETTARLSLRTAETDEETPDVLSLTGSTVNVPSTPKLVDYSKCRATLPKICPFDETKIKSCVMAYHLRIIRAIEGDDDDDDEDSSNGNDDDNDEAAILLSCSNKNNNNNSKSSKGNGGKSNVGKRNGVGGGGGGGNSGSSSSKWIKYHLKVPQDVVLRRRTFRRGLRRTNSIDHLLTRTAHAAAAQTLSSRNKSQSHSSVAGSLASSLASSHSASSLLGRRLSRRSSSGGTSTNSGDSNQNAKFDLKQHMVSSAKKPFVAPFPVPLSRENSIDHLEQVLAAAEAFGGGSGKIASGGGGGGRGRTHSESKSKKTIAGFSPLGVKRNSLSSSRRSSGNSAQNARFSPFEGNEFSINLNDVGALANRRRSSGSRGEEYAPLADPPLWNSSLSPRFQDRQVYSDEELIKEEKPKRRIRQNRRSSFVAGSKIERFDNNNNTTSTSRNGSRKNLRGGRQRHRLSLDNAESYTEWKIDLMVNG